MFASIKSAALAAILGLGAFAATPAAADSLTIGFGHHGGVHVSGHYGSGGYYGHGHGHPGCSPWRAVDKAERMGVRRARVVDAGRRGVVVRGHRWGGPVKVVFGNARHCPVRAMY